MRFIVLDFETLNSSRDSGFSFCVTEFQNGLPGRSVTKRFKPVNTHVSIWAMKSFGISQDDVDQLPPFQVSWQEVCDSFGADAFIVCHNAEFDISILRKCLATSECDVSSFTYICNLALSKLAWPHRKRYGLKHLSEHFQIELSHHVPESDCIATGKIFTNGLLRLGMTLSLPNEIVLERLALLNSTLVKRFSKKVVINES